MRGYKGNAVSIDMKFRADFEKQLKQQEKDGAAIRREITTMKKTIAKLAKILKK